MNELLREINELESEKRAIDERLRVIMPRLRELRERHAFESSGLKPGDIVERNGHRYKLASMDPLGLGSIEVRGHKQTKSGWHKSTKFITLNPESLTKVEP